MVGDQCKHDTTGCDFVNNFISYKLSFKQHYYKRHRYNILTYSVIPAASPHTQRIVSLTVNNWIITSVLVGSRSAAAAAGCRWMPAVCCCIYRMKLG